MGQPPDSSDVPEKPAQGQPSDGSSGASPAAPVAKPRRRRLKRWLLGLGLVAGILVLLGSIGVGVTEHYTSQPSFCGSCHIMQPYYETWQADLHGGELGVACVECHYAPGERTTLKAKFRGLSQVMSYFSGRYGKTRPRAYVAQASCMTTGCHGDEQFMDKPLKLGSVRFVHAKHLKRTAHQEKPFQARLEEVARKLEDRLGEERFAELRGVARRAGPAEQRYEAMSRLCRKWDADIGRPTLVEFSQLEHRGVRIAQLENLQCTDCHSYNGRWSDFPGQQREHHFQVSGSTCYTCHFNNEAFNTGTAECMLCHTPPQKKITVHEQLSESVRQKLGTEKLGRQPIRMDHSEIVARKIDCRACHADVITGDAAVTRRDCERCHDQPRFFADWKEPFSVDLAARYHEVHVPQQRAKCLDCHSEIHHRLMENDGEPLEPRFLSAAMSDCLHCHPGHHTEQLQLLLGRGGETVPRSDPHMMFGARTNCYGCHTKLEEIDGREVMVATESACVACHGEEYARTFQQWNAALALTLSDAEAAYESARQRLLEAASAPAEARNRAEKLLAAAGADLRLVKRGKGVHNITYALQLLDGVTAHCREAEQALAGGER